MVYSSVYSNLSELTWLVCRIEHVILGAKGQLCQFGERQLLGITWTQALCQSKEQFGTLFGLD